MMQNWRFYTSTMKIGQKYSLFRKAVHQYHSNYFSELAEIERIEKGGSVRLIILKPFSHLYNFPWWLEADDQLKPFYQTEQECLSEIIINGNFSEELVSRIRQLG